MSGSARGRFALGAVALAIVCVPAASAAAATLPDGRAYEQVSPVDKNGVDTGPAVASTDGNGANWVAIGGCCGATTASAELFQSSRTASGWQTTGKTPTPSNPLVGILQEQAPLWWSPDLSKTIYTTPGSYTPADNRPAGPGSTSYLDLYLQNPDGSMNWLSTGPFSGAGTNPFSATFADATPDGNFVGFNTQERLTSDATGLADLNTPPQFVYERNVATGTTSLIDVTTTTLGAAAASGDATITVLSSQAFAAGQPITVGTGASQESGTVASVPDATHITLASALAQAHAAGAAVEALISPDGAILGNGNWLDQSFLPADLFGTTTNAIAATGPSEGTKVFFESPPTFAGGSGGAEGVGAAHLYMRDLSTNTTTPLDDPAASVCGGGGCTGSARYEGASQDGSLVFFTSDEAGLGGTTTTDTELYEFNTTNAAIGPAPAMSVIPLSTGGPGGSADGNVIGVTAIANDGSHIYFVGNGVLGGTNAQGQSATLNQPNLYVVDTSTGATTFIATLSANDASGCQPNCDTNGASGPLVAEPDINRPAVPTPDGSVMAFDSNANLTGENPSGPDTTLTADAAAGDTSITVASTAGMVAYRAIDIQSPSGAEKVAIASVPDGTTLTLRRPLIFSHASGDPITQLAPYEIYRYTASDNALTCVSCTPAGVTPIGSAVLGGTAGGTYDPAGQSVAMNSDGSRIFFDSPDPLVPQDTNTGAFPGGFGSLTLSEDVYEWEGGTRSLISDGTSSTGSVLSGTTPSGNDVFFTTMSALVPQDGDGYGDIYDARIGGGFPAPSGPQPGTCAAADTCRTAVGPTVFFPIPGSATLIAPNVPGPSFSVASISGAQKKRFAKTGKLTLTVSANAPGRIAATVYGHLSGLKAQVAWASATLTGASGGTAQLKLHLNKAARKVLSKHHKLSLQISVAYSLSTTADVATLTLKPPHKAHRQRAGTRQASATSSHRGAVKGA